jgi:hypothetical protein
MSQFFDQYNAILEKSLQKVRLRVDPNVKYAEDFAQYDGYVGYILAETDDSFDFFYENSTVTLPKNVVLVEQNIGAPTRFFQGLAGVQPGGDKASSGGGLAGALGSIARQGTQAAGSGLAALGRAGLAMHGIPSSAYSGNSSNASQSIPPKSTDQTKQSIDKTKSLLLKNKNNNAAININGVDYGIISIKDSSGKNHTTLQGNILILASYNIFDNLIQNSWSSLNEAGTAGLQFPMWGRPASPTATQPTATAATQPTATATTTTTPTAPVSGAGAAINYLQMSSITPANLKSKKLLNTPLQITLQPIMQQSTSSSATQAAVSPVDYNAMFTVSPNNAEILVTFL